jgi:hypothetical protein
MVQSYVHPAEQAADGLQDAIGILQENNARRLEAVRPTTSGQHTYHAWSPTTQTMTYLTSDMEHLFVTPLLQSIDHSSAEGRKVAKFIGKRIRGAINELPGVVEDSEQFGRKLGRIQRAITAVRNYAQSDKKVAA